jgi:hypothetical protein
MAHTKDGWVWATSGTIDGITRLTREIFYNDSIVLENERSEGRRHQIQVWDVIAKEVYRHDGEKKLDMLVKKRGRLYRLIAIE